MYSSCSENVSEKRRRKRGHVSRRSGHTSENRRRKARQVAKAIHREHWTGKGRKRSRIHVRGVEVTMMMTMRNPKKDGLDVMRGGVGDGIIIGVQVNLMYLTQS